MGHKFEIHRTSDLNRGHNSPALNVADGAYWNDQENRVEVEINTLEELLKIARDNDSWIRLCFPDNRMRGEQADLPIIEIQDEELRT